MILMGVVWEWGTHEREVPGISLNKIQPTKKWLQQSPGNFLPHLAYMNWFAVFFIHHCFFQGHEFVKLHLPSNMAFLVEKVPSSTSVPRNDITSHSSCKREKFATLLWGDMFIYSAFFPVPLYWFLSILKCRNCSSWAPKQISRENAASQDSKPSIPIQSHTLHAPDHITKVSEHDFDPLGRAISCRLTNCDKLSSLRLMAGKTPSVTDSRTDTLNIYM